MKLIKLQVIFGLGLIITGFLFDFGFLAPRITDAFKTDPTPFLNSFSTYIYDLMKTYVIYLGILNIALSFLKIHFTGSPKLNLLILISMVAGTVIFVSAGIWYANAGPSFKWETRCTVLTIGMFGILMSLGLEIYRLISVKNYS